MRHLQHLLLVDDDTVGILEHGYQALVQVLDGLKPATAAHERMHHAALQRARPEECDLVDQVAEVLRLMLREQVELPLRLDLEDAERLARANHVVGGNVVERQRVDVEVGRHVAVDQLHGLAEGGQHAEAEHVELDEAERLDVVLVEGDHHDAVRGRLDRREPVSGALLPQDQAR